MDVNVQRKDYLLFEIKKRLSTVCKEKGSVSVYAVYLSKVVMPEIGRHFKIHFSK
jgi:hypothetical protein